VDLSVMSRFFALLALLAGAGALVAIASAIAPSGPLRRFREDIAPLALPLAWLVAAVCMAGSLYFSDVAHLTPCRLCWYQRIAMYPLAVILGIAALRRDVDIRRYAIPLAAIGAAISTYHIQLERFPEQRTFCSVDAPCNIPPVQEFGFVTLAVMALCGFTAIIALLAVARPQHLLDERPSAASSRHPSTTDSRSDQELV
jgi:disulfide bond formation protein DsbB